MEKEDYRRDSDDLSRIKRFDSEQEIYKSNDYIAGNYNHEQNLNQNVVEPNNVTTFIHPLDEQQQSSQLIVDKSQDNFLKERSETINNFEENQMVNSQIQQKIYIEYEENLSRNPFMSSSQNSMTTNSNNNFNSRQRNDHQSRSEDGRNIVGQMTPTEVLEEDDENVSFGEKSPNRNRNMFQVNQNYQYNPNSSPQSSNLSHAYQNNRPQRISFPFTIPISSNDFLEDDDLRRFSGGTVLTTEAQLQARDSIRNVDSVTERIPVPKELQEANRNKDSPIPFFDQRKTSFERNIEIQNNFQRLIRMQTCPNDTKSNNEKGLYNHRLSNELFVSEYRNQSGNYVRKNSDLTENSNAPSPKVDPLNKNLYYLDDDTPKSQKRKSTIEKKIASKDVSRKQSQIKTNDKGFQSELSKQESGIKQYDIEIKQNNKEINNNENQNSEAILKCQIQEHDGEKIIMVCVDPYCEAQYRLCCGYCNQLHSRHVKSLMRLQEYRYQILQASQILDSNEIKQNRDEKSSDQNKINHKELLYLCMQKQNQIHLEIKKYFDNTFLQIQKIVEEKEKEILTYISSFDEEYNYFSDKLKVLEDKNYLNLTNKDIQKLFNLQKQPTKFLEHQRINENFRKKQLAEIDDHVYDYYVNLEQIFDDCIIQSDSLLFDLLQKLTAKPNSTRYQSSNINSPVKEQTNNQNGFTPPKKIQNQNSNSKNSNQLSPLQRFVTNTDPSILKQTNNLSMTDKGVPGYKRVNELPAWCHQMLHISRSLKKFGNYKFEKVIPSTINLGIQQNMKNDNIYIGNWLNYMKEGNGVEYCKKEQSYYEGEWQFNQKNGHGRIICKNDIVYEGVFENNKKCGFGILYQFGGKRYEGQWDNDQPQGRGTQFYPNGDIFIGQFSNGLKSGEGEYKYFDGTTLTGYWQNDQANGQCQYVKLDGSTYQGEYKNGKKEGYGTFIWNDGRKYIGQWQNGVQNGGGYYTNHLGITVQGIWKNGKKVQTNESEFTKTIIR